MNKEFWLDAFKNNWYLVVLLAVAILGFIGHFIRSYAVSPASLDLSTSGTIPVSPEPVPEVNIGVKNDREQTEQQINEYRRLVDEHPDSADAPSLLTAAGNLYYQKLLDYEKAAECYEEVLGTYPNWENIRNVYVQLASCYERMENWEKARRVYRRMMDAFPEDSQEYQYAKAKYEGGLP